MKSNGWLVLFFILSTSGTSASADEGRESETAIVPYGIEARLADGTNAFGAATCFLEHGGTLTKIPGASPPDMWRARYTIGVWGGGTRCLDKSIVLIKKELFSQLETF